MTPRIAIIGEFNPASRSHGALNASLDHIKTRFGFDFDYTWVDTTDVENSGSSLLDAFAGFWSAPGGLFLSLQGTLDAITYARKNNIPHLATCGGFQHTILEYARNVLDIKEAGHEDYTPEASSLVISRLTCALHGTSGKVYVSSATKAYESYRRTEIEENFLCNFGVSPLFAERLTQAALIISGIDQAGEVRILELPAHRFYVATLFVPHTRSTPDAPHPLIRDFVKAVIR